MNTPVALVVMFSRAFPKLNSEKQLWTEVWDAQMVQQLSDISSNRTADKPDAERFRPHFTHLYGMDMKTSLFTNSDVEFEVGMDVEAEVQAEVMVEVGVKDIEVEVKDVEMEVEVTPIEIQIEAEVEVIIL